MKRSQICLIFIFVVGTAAFITPVLNLDWLDELINWGTVSAILVLLAIAVFFFKFEEAEVGSKEIALIGMLGTVSAVLRVPFATIPSVQPCTYLIICTGYVFGAFPGFMVGSISALVSNFFLGQGPWTIYQMFAWGLAGVAAAYFRKLNLNINWLIALGFFWGYIFGVIMNLWFWTSFVYPLTLRTFLVAQLNSIWFDSFHAAGNVIFLALLGKKTVMILERYRKKFQWTILSPEHKEKVSQV